jgi:Predicted hydrolases or acyltransferases (alpha/beta hydrolase superfamily)
LKVAYKADNLNIHYSDEGNGDTIVLLHGWGANIDVYKSITDSLVPYFRVIALDLPGFGKSDEPSFPYSVIDFAEFVIAFLKQLNIKTASFIGHSHGGRITIEIASRNDNPFALEKIVLLDSAGIVPVKTSKQQFKIKCFKASKWILNIPPVKALFPDALEKLKKRSGSADYNAATPMMRQSLVMAVNTDMRDKMPHIKVPCLLIWGEKDTATPVSDGKLMENFIPNSGLVLLQNAGHYSFLDNPYTFKKVLFSFFNIHT